MNAVSLKSKKKEKKKRPYCNHGLPQPLKAIITSLSNPRQPPGRPKISPIFPPGPKSKLQDHRTGYFQPCLLLQMACPIGPSQPVSCNS